MHSKTLLIAATGLAFAFGGLSAASAQDLTQTHVRRTEVNQRLVNQDRRITAKAEVGAISPMKAARLHAADHRVLRKERRYALAHNGRISRTEQVRLNRRENHVSRRIG